MISVEKAGVLHLIAALERLKQSGCTHQDGNHLWCMDWIISNDDPNQSIDVRSKCAIGTLSRLKSMLRTLHTISTSIAESVQLVGSQSADLILQSGFSSLPDDVLARIFEIHHRDLLDRVGHETGMPSANGSNVLANVSRRFRRIALHIPSIWADISSYHRERWITTLKTRCQAPEVFIVLNSHKSRKRFSDFLRFIHPANQWKGLYIQYHDDRDGSKVFKRITTNFGGDLSSVEKLSIIVDKTQIDNRKIIRRRTIREEEDEEGDSGPELSSASSDSVRNRTAKVSTKIPPSDSTLLRSWDLTKLTELTVKNLVPPNLRCPNLRTCCLETSSGRVALAWSSRAMQNLFESAPLLESLTLKLSNARNYSMLTGWRPKPFKLNNLSSLTIIIEGNTEILIVKFIMCVLDVTDITDLKISMKYVKDDDEEEEEDGTIFNFWLGCIFKGENYSHVETLHIELVDGPRHIPFSDIFGAVPQLRHLTFELPGRLLVSDERKETDEGCTPLKELRSLHLKNCDLFHGCDVLTFFKKYNQQAGLEKFERIEIDGCSDLRHLKEEYQDLLGDKLVWKG